MATGIDDPICIDSNGKVSRFRQLVAEKKASRDEPPLEATIQSPTFSDYSKKSVNQTDVDISKSSSPRKLDKASEKPLDFTLIGEGEDFPEYFEIKAKYAVCLKNNASEEDEIYDNHPRNIDLGRENVMANDINSKENKHPNLSEMSVEPRTSQVSEGIAIEGFGNLNKPDEWLNEKANKMLGSGRQQESGVDVIQTDDTIPGGVSIVTSSSAETSLSLNANSKPENPFGRLVNISNDECTTNYELDLTKGVKVEPRPSRTTCEDSFGLSSSNDLRAAAATGRDAASVTPKQENNQERLGRLGCDIDTFDGTDVLSFIGSSLWNEAIPEENYHAKDNIISNNITQKKEKKENKCLNHCAFNEAKENLMTSAEKVKKIEAFLLSAVDGMLSPMPILEEFNVNKTDRKVGHGKVLKDGCKPVICTPRSESDKNIPFGDLMTPLKGKVKKCVSVEIETNEMNQSRLVSDDEMSSLEGGDFGSPKCIRDIAVLTEDGEGNLPNDKSISLEKKDGLYMANELKGKKKTEMMQPTTTTFMERNNTVVTEVRFADQTCVELTEKSKHYKSDAARFKRDARKANEEVGILRARYELSMHENLKMKGLVESLMMQLDEQNSREKTLNEAHQLELKHLDETHHSNLKKWEETYQSHLRSSERQIECLNERLKESITANCSLQSKVDVLHEKWESKLEENFLEKDLIASLKDRVNTTDASLSKADSSIHAMQTRIEDLQRLCDRQQNELDREREERIMVEHDRDALQFHHDNLHSQLVHWNHKSEISNDSLSFCEDERCDFVVNDEKELKTGEQDCFAKRNTFFTPTSNLLSQTLHSELKRRNSARERLVQTERLLNTMKSKASQFQIDLEDSKARNALLEDELQVKNQHIADLEEELICKSRQNGKSGDDATHNLTHRDDPSLIINAQSNTRDELVREVTDLLDRLDLVGGALEKTEEELTTSRQQQAQAEERTTELSNLLEEAEDELASVREKLFESDCRLNDLIRELNEKETELTAIRQRQACPEERQCALSSKNNPQRSISEFSEDEFARGDSKNHSSQMQRRLYSDLFSKLERIIRSHEDDNQIATRKLYKYCQKITQLGATLHRIQQHLLKKFIVNTNFHEQALSKLDTEQATGMLIRDNIFDSRHQGDRTSASKYAPSENSSIDMFRIEKALASGNERNLGAKSVQNLAVDPENSPAHFNSSVHFLTATSTTTPTPVDASSFGRTPQNSDNYYQQKLAQLRDENSIAHECLAAVRKERDQANVEMHKAISDLEEAHDKLYKMENEFHLEVSTLKNERNQHRLERNNILTSYEETKHEFERFREQMGKKLSVVINDLKDYKIKNEELVRQASTSDDETCQTVYLLRQQNANFVQQISNIRQEIETFHIELQNERALMRATQEETESVLFELERAKGDLKRSKTESDEVKAVAEELEQEIDHLRKQVSQQQVELDADNQSLSKAKNVLEKERSQFEKKLHTLESCHKKEKSETEIKIYDLEAKLRDAEQRRLSSLAQFQDCANRQVSLEIALKSKQDECNIKQEQLQHLATQMKEMEKGMTSAHESLNDIKSELVNAKKTIDAKSTKIIETEGEIKKFLTDLNSKELLLANARDETRHLKDELANLRSELSGKDEYYHNIVAEKERRLEMLEEDRENRSTWFEEQLIILKSEHNNKTSELQRIVERLREDSDVSNKAHQESSQKAKLLIKELQKSLHERNLEVEQCKTSISILESELLHQNNVQNNLESDIARQQNEIDSLHVDLKDKTEMHRQLVKDLENSRKQITVLDNQRYAMEQDYKSLTNDYESTKQELVSSLMDIERMKTKYQDDDLTSKTKMVELTMEKDILVSKYTSTRLAVKSSVEERNLLSQQLNSLKETLQQAEIQEKRQCEEINKLRMHNGKLNHKCTTLREYIKKLNEKVGSWEENYLSQSKDLQRHQQEISRLKNQIKSLQSEIISMNGVVM